MQPKETHAPPRVSRTAAAPGDTIRVLSTFWRRAQPELPVGLALLVLAIGERVVNLAVYTGSFDEGIRAQQLFLMSRGFRPFRDIFASQGVILLDALFPFYLLGGETLSAIRLGVGVYSLFALAGIYLSARAIAGGWAGISALALLVLSPIFLQGSRLALAEVPSIAPASLGLAAALRYQGKGERRWALLTAVLIALALLAKVMAAPVLIAAGIALFLRGKRSLPDVLIASALGAATVALTVAIVGPRGVQEQLLAYRSGASAALEARGGEVLAHFVQALRSEGPVLPALAAIGAMVLLRRSPARALPPIAWLTATVAMLALYDDVSEKHFVYLVPPLVLLASAPVPLVVREWRTGSVFAWRVAAAALLALCVVLLARGLAQQAQIIWPDVAGIEQRRDRAIERELTLQLVRLAAPNEFVISDNPLAAFEARRMVVPWLADPSGTRIDAGTLTSALLIQKVDQYRPRAVVTWDRRTGRLEDYLSWLDANYRLVDTYGNGAWRLYAAPAG